MNRIFTSIFVTGLFITACTNVQSPENVTDEFWQAVKAGNEKTVAQFVTNDSRGSVQLSDHRLRNITVDFGEVRILKNDAKIATIVRFSDRDDEPKKRLDTVLKKENGQWKVDFSHTMSALHHRDPFAGLVKQLEKMRTDFSADFNDLLNQLGDQLPELENKFKENGEAVLKELEKSLTEKSPEIRKYMNDLKEAMEKALEDSMEKIPKKEKEAPNSGAITI